MKVFAQKNTNKGIDANSQERIGCKWNDWLLDLLVHKRVRKSAVANPISGENQENGYLARKTTPLGVLKR